MATTPSTLYRVDSPLQLLRLHPVFLGSPTRRIYAQFTYEMSQHNRLQLRVLSTLRAILRELVATVDNRVGSPPVHDVSRLFFI